MVIVDTSVWIDYLRGVPSPHVDWLETEMDRQRLGLTDLILCEVLQGITDDKQFAEIRRELLKFEVFNMGGAQLAVTAAQNYRILRTKGRTVRKTIDCLIATFCIVHDHSLLHNDSDFDAFEKQLNLRVVHL